MVCDGKQEGAFQGLITYMLPDPEFEQNVINVLLAPTEKPLTPSLHSDGICTNRAQEVGNDYLKVVMHTALSPPSLQTMACLDNPLESTSNPDALCHI